MRCVLRLDRLVLEGILLSGSWVSFGLCVSCGDVSWFKLAMLIDREIQMQ